MSAGDELVAALSPADRDHRAGLRRQLHALALEEPAPLPMAMRRDVGPSQRRPTSSYAATRRARPAGRTGFPAALGNPAAAALGLAAAAASGDGGRRLAVALDHPPRPTRSPPACW